VRIALVTSLERGGPLEHAILLARDLVALGADVRAVAVDERVAERFDAAGARVAIIPLVRPFDPVGAIRVHRFVAGADVVHTHDRRAGLWVRMLKVPGTFKNVHTLHGLPEPFLTEAPPSLKARIAYRGLDRGLRRFTDVLVTPSHAMARLLHERIGYELDELVVVPNGVDVPDAMIERGDRVGTVALLEPVKGLEYLIDAMRILDRPLVIFGTGSQEAALRARAAGLDVEFAGYVPATEALTRLSVFVLPSIMENSPLALLEAMAAGIPVVASDVGGIPEYAPPGALVPPRDPAAHAAAIAALDDPALLARRNADGRAAAEEHSARRVAERLLDLYLTATRGRRAAP
jgi:glycosyltransferase involved in cell wall biosynthesis